VPPPPPPIRSTTLATPATPSLPLVRTWLPLSAAVAIGTVLEQRQTETLPPAQSSIDRLVDVSLRLVLQGFAARPLNAALGARNTVQLGCLLMALGALAAGMFAAPLAQLSAHHLLQSGLHVAEVGAATLVAVAANASRDPAAMRVCSLVAMHMAVTLGPGLLPLLLSRAGKDVGSVGPWLLLALLPAPLVALVRPID